MVEYKVRPAKIEDIHTMYDISCRAHMTTSYTSIIDSNHLQRYIEHYTPNKISFTLFESRMRQTLDDTHTTALAAIDVSGRVVGYAFLRTNNDIAVLTSIFVDSKHDGRGVGSLLMHKILNGIKKQIALDVLQDNKNAISFYQKHNFTYLQPSKKTYFGARLITMIKY